MDDSMIEATQALEFSDYGETDDEPENDKPVGYLNVPCQKGFAGKLFPVQQGENIIGRGENCSICIPLKGLSREHACIEVKGEAHFIYDKGSRNRTKRNKHFLAASVRYELKDKDALTFGDVDCHYQVGGQLEADGDETGSETGSECMFQTAAVDEELDETGNTSENTKSKLLGDLDDDGADSDASSDILQPTQPFTNASTTQSMLGRNKTHNGDTTHATVLETPAPSKSKRFTDNLTLPESDADTTDDEGADRHGMSTMVVADSQDDSETDKSHLIGAATQAYVCDSDITTDEESVSSPKRRSILMQATQRYTESDISTCSEESPEKSARKQSLLTAATQAYGTDEGESPPKKSKAKNRAEPTVPYTMAAGIEPTQAYDMDEEEEKSKGKNRAEPTVPYTMAPGIEPTQAYDMDEEEEEAEEKSVAKLYEPTQAYNMEEDSDEEEEKQKDEKKSSNLLQQATQAYTEDLDKHTDKEEENAESDTSEEFVLDGDTENEDNDEDEAEQIMAAPTLAMGVDEPDETEAETVVADDATQVFNNKDKEGETQVFTDDATQVIDENKATSTKPTVSGDAETQVFTEDATQVFEDHESSKKKHKIDTAATDETLVVNEDATQVFEEERKPCVKDKKEVVFEDATQVFEDDEKIKSSDNQTDDTQAFNEEGTTETNTKSWGSEEATQVFDTETHVETPGKQVLEDKKVDKGEATQAFAAGDEEEEFDINAMSTFAAEEETIEDEDTEGDEEMDVGKTGHEDATQVFDDDAGTVNVEEISAKPPSASKSNAKGKKESNQDDATQVFEDQTAPVGEADETVAVQEDISTVTDKTTTATVKPTRGGRGKSSRKSVKEKETQNISEIATQAIEDSTVKISEPNATVMVSEDATVAISESDNETKELNTRKGRSRSTISKIDAKLKAVEKREAATLMVEDATLPVSDIENESVSKGSETGKKQSQRKGKTNKKMEDNEITTTCEAETVPVADTVVVEEEVIEETAKPKRKGRRGASQKVEDVLKSSPEKTENVKDATQKEPDLDKEKGPKQRRRGRESTAVEEVKVSEENTRKAGRGTRKKTEKGNDLTSVQGKTTGVNQSEKDKELPGKTESDLHQEIEPATQIYSDEVKGADDHATNEAATQRYGDDSDTPGTSGKEEATEVCEEEDSTPDIAELGLVDDDSEEESLLIPKPPLVPIPSRSPLKSALASPKKKREKSPSPKRVKFVSQSSDSSSEGPTRPKRGKRQILQAKDRQEDTKVKGKAGQRKGTRGKAKADEDEEDTNEKEEPVDSVSVDSVDESSTSSRGGRRKSAVGKKVAVLDETDEVETAKPSRGRKGRKPADEETTAESEETVEIEITKASRGRKSRTPVTVDSSDVPDGKDEAKPGKQSRGKNNKSVVVEQADVPEESKEVETARPSRGRTNKKQTDVVQGTVVKNSKNSSKTENVSQDSEISDTKRPTRGKGSKKPVNVKSVEDSKDKNDSEKDVKIEEIEVEKPVSETKGGRTATRSKLKNVNKNVSGPSKDEPKATVTSEEIAVGKRRTRGKTKDVDIVSDSVGDDGKIDTAVKVEHIEDKSSENDSALGKRTSAKAKTGGKKETKNTGKVQKCDTLEVGLKRSFRTHGCGDDGQDSEQSSLEQTANDSKDCAKPVQQTSRQSIRAAKKIETKEKNVKADEKELSKPNKKGKMVNSKDNNSDLNTSKVKEEMPKPSRATRGKRKESPDTEEDDQSVETPAKKQKTKSTQGTPAQSPAVASRRGQVTETPKSSSKRVSAVSTPTTKGSKDLDSSVVNSPTLRKSTVSTSKPKVMFTGVVDEQGEKTVKDLGGEMVSSVYDCTHLVTDQIRRTVKFLCCLSRGVPIVTPQWLVSTKGSGFFSDPSPFIVRDNASEKKFKFNLLSSLDKASEKQLLAGYKIHITKSVKPEPAQMKDIVQCAGAQYLASMPKTATEGTVVISCPDDKATCQGAISVGIPVVSAEFVLTGVLRQEVDISAHLLFSSSNGSKRQASGPATESSAAKKRKR